MAFRLSPLVVDVMILYVGSQPALSWVTFPSGSLLGVQSISIPPQPSGCSPQMVLAGISQQPGEQLKSVSFTRDLGIEVEYFVEFSQYPLRRRARCLGRASFSNAVRHNPFKPHHRRFGTCHSATVRSHQLLVWYGLFFGRGCSLRLERP